MPWRLINPEKYKNVLKDTAPPALDHTQGMGFQKTQVFQAEKSVINSVDK